MDTRDGTGVAAGLRPPGSSTDLHVDVPAAATAVVLNVTITESVDAGYVQVYPTAGGTPGASSNLNVPGPGTTIANLVIVPLGANDSLTFFDHAGGHLVADLLGYFVPPTLLAGRLVTFAAPQRTLDTRNDGSTLTAGGTHRLPVLTTASPSGGIVPPGASAVIMNLTAVDTAEPGLPAGVYRSVGPGHVVERQLHDRRHQCQPRDRPHCERRLGDDLRSHVDRRRGGHHRLLHGDEHGARARWSLRPVRSDSARRYPSAGRPVPHAEHARRRPGIRGRDRSVRDGQRCSSTRRSSAPLTPAYLQVFPADLSTAGASSNVNVNGPGRTRPNAVISALNGGRVDVYLHSGGDFIIDAAGYFTAVP